MEELFNKMTQLPKSVCNCPCIINIDNSIAIVQLSFRPEVYARIRFNIYIYTYVGNILVKNSFKGGSF